MKDPRYHIKSLNAETRDVLDELDRDYKPAVSTYQVAEC